jgi:hypothetical protein
MGIKEGARGKVQGHGVDRQIAPGKIVVEGAVVHHRVIARNGIGLGAGARHIQQESWTFRRRSPIQAPSILGQLQFKLNGSVLAVGAGLPHPEGRFGVREILHQPPGRRRSLRPGGSSGHTMERRIRNHQIEIEEPSPEIPMLEMEQPITHRSSHQGYPTRAGRLQKLGPKGGGNTREIQGA